MNTILDLNQSCSKCGRPGVGPNGLCLICSGNAPHPDQIPRAESRIKPSEVQHKGGLARSLLSLILQVERANDKHFHSKPLSGGLVVEIGIAEKFNLRISRALPAAPSKTEWRTVIDYLPEAYQPEAEVLPKDYEWNGRKYLSAYWPIKKKLI